MDPFERYPVVWDLYFRADKNAGGGPARVRCVAVRPGSGRR